MKTPERALDIFELLRKIDTSKTCIYSDLTDPQKKGFAPLVVMRWMSGTGDAAQIAMLNECVNPYVFSLGKHPHLLMQCLQVSSSGQPKRYYWLGLKTNKKKSETMRVLQEFFELSAREVKTYPIPPVNELVSMAEMLGWESAEIQKLKKESG